MAQKSPLEQVKARWGSKEAAVDAILAVIGDHDGRTKPRLRQARNEQLLKLWEAGQAVQKQFGSRGALVDAIMKLKFPKGGADDTYRARVAGYGVRRLLETYKQLQPKG